MQAKLHESEKTALEQRAEILRERQALLDSEKRHQDIQEIRMREQDSARVVEARLRDICAPKRRSGRGERFDPATVVVCSWHLS